MINRTYKVQNFLHFLFHFLYHSICYSLLTLFFKNTLSTFLLHISLKIIESYEFVNFHNGCRSEIHQYEVVTICKSKFENFHKPKFLYSDVFLFENIFRNYVLWIRTVLFKNFYVQAFQNPLSKLQFLILHQLSYAVPFEVMNTVFRCYNQLGFSSTDVTILHDKDCKIQEMVKELRICIDDNFLILASYEYTTLRIIKQFVITL